MTQQELIPHLFRTEAGKITAVLCKHFGLEHLEAAEDITSETFLAALETWPYKGVPENPVAWLYTVAKNKTRNHIAHNHIFNEKVAVHIENDTAGKEEMDIDLSDANIADSQLKTLFAICHPSLPVETQVGLALRILCGFGIEEIANAFLTGKETINKRLQRGKEKLRTENIRIELPSKADINNRLDVVLTTLYLLFNEGYYSESNNAVIREDLCLEAMRLAHLLTENEHTALPPVNALFALMCFHASRFEARKNTRGEMVLYDEQDKALWNHELIARGAYYLHKAATGNRLSKYHLEATIAFWHTQKEDTKEKWENILQLYNRLLQLEYSPIAALNRTFALAKANGIEEAIAEAEKLQLTNNQYYYTLLGELYKNIDRNKAKEHLEKALSLAKTDSDQQVIQKRMEFLSK